MLNVGLDAAFMGPLGLGVRGAAIATVLAQGISAVLGVVYILRGYPGAALYAPGSSGLPRAAP